MSVPSMYTLPLSGARSLSTCFKKTLLPEPLPPMMTMLSPFSMRRSKPSRTFFWPNALCRFTASIIQASFIH